MSTEGFQYVIINEENEKMAFRQQSIEKLYLCQHKLIQKQYIRCIRTITKLDFPARWAGLIDNDIPKLLGTSEEKSVVTGLHVLHALVSVYEFEMEEDREPLFKILQATFG